MCLPAGSLVPSEGLATESAGPALAHLSSRQRLAPGPDSFTRRHQLYLGFSLL